ncbi:Uncharacterised protein [Streptococcus pneumoniae]|nr:Uncharacterised protein [Streptococcus pneumoniae]CGF61118.1 Uncharacterised protein [Streptococcus pneumoniae]CIV41806.1 Uncharacterised protein [Streptococcus pneumoniae]CIV51132.1 Uncharacterised protein [Streptococcus pneumoniae]CJG74298.1 Uncharacterised protein [Streptococcus pneumoniae]
MFMRQVWDNQALHSCISQIFDKVLHTVLKEGVEVGHDDQWNLCFNGFQGFN